MLLLLLLLLMMILLLFLLLMPGTIEQSQGTPLVPPGGHHGTLLLGPTQLAPSQR